MFAMTSATVMNLSLVYEAWAKYHNRSHSDVFIVIELSSKFHHGNLCLFSCYKKTALN